MAPTRFGVVSKTGAVSGSELYCASVKHVWSYGQTRPTLNVIEAEALGSLSSVTVAVIKFVTIGSRKCLD